MFRIGLKLANYNLTKIEGCLKLLQLTPPTTKKEIKSKYFEFAKQLHPDIKDASGSPPNPKELQKRSESFIEITKAYKYLSELSEN
jgi:DnaJ-class molecular chaperone